MVDYKGYWVLTRTTDYRLDDDDDAQSGLLGDRSGHVSQIIRLKGQRKRASDIPISTRRLGNENGNAIHCSMHAVGVGSIGCGEKRGWRRERLDCVN